MRRPSTIILIECQLLTSVGLANQEPHRHQGQRHVVMPALPGTNLILVHSHLALASFEARLNASARLDHSCQFPKRRFMECHPTSIARREVVMIAVAGVIVAGVAR